MRTDTTMRYEALRDKRVLVVDDDAMFRHQLTYRLEGAGCHVVAVGSHEGAERAIKDAEQPFHVAIVDMVIPRREGEQAGSGLLGRQLAQDIRVWSRQTQLIGISNFVTDEAVRPIFRLFTELILKNDLFSDERALGLFEAIDNALMEKPMPRTLIVHGNDDRSAAQLQRLMDRRFELGTPTILRAKGRLTVDLEAILQRRLDLVLVLLTQDDLIVRSNALLERDPANGAPAATQEWRSLQEVIFEVGLFWGKIQGVGGQVIAVTWPDIAHPLASYGIPCIEVVDGDLETAEGTLRRHLESLGWLP